MSHDASTQPPRTGEHLSPMTIRRLARGGLAPELAKEALAHIRVCPTCKSAVDAAYRERHGASTNASVGRGPWLTRPAVRLLAIALLLALAALLAQVVVARGFLVRQQLDRRPFSAGLVEYDPSGSASAVAVVYTDSGVIPLPPEAPGPEDPEGHHYASPPLPVDPTVMLTTRTDRCDLIVGSRSTYRPRGRVHLVRWEHRTNRFRCVYVLDILDYIPNVKADELRDIAIEQIAVARSRRPGELPRVLVWWRHHDADDGGVSLFTYDQNAEDDPLVYHGTVFASSWAFPVGPAPSFEPVLRVPEGEHDLVPLVWRVNTFLAGEGSVPRPDDGIGVGVTLLDPFSVEADCLSPFAGGALADEMGLSAEYGLASWLIPRFAPPVNPLNGSELSVAQEVLAEGRLMLHLNNQVFVLDAPRRSLEYQESCDIWENAAGHDLKARAETLFRDQIHRLGPADAGGSALTGPEIDELLREDRRAWQEVHESYDCDEATAQYRQFLDDFYAPGVD